jgi:hypothetical protein
MKQCVCFSQLLCDEWRVEAESLNLVQVTGEVLEVDLTFAFEPNSKRGALRVVSRPRYRRTASFP